MKTIKILQNNMFKIKTSYFKNFIQITKIKIFHKPLFHYIASKYFVHVKTIH